MEDTVRELLAMTHAQNIAMQAIVSMIEEIEPGSRLMILSALEGAAASIETEVLIQKLEELIEVLDV